MHSNAMFPPPSPTRTILKPTLSIIVYYTQEHFFQSLTIMRQLRRIAMFNVSKYKKKSSLKDYNANIMY